MTAQLEPVGGRRSPWLALARVGMIVLFLTPLAFMVAGSLRRVGLAPPAGFEVLPPGPGLTSYRQVAREIPLGTAFKNSVLVVAFAVPLAVTVASMAGFVLAQLAAPVRRLALGATLALLLVPLPMLWVARFVLYLRLGILDTLAPLVAPALAGTTPFTVLLAYRAFRRVPPELFEAARAEGASALRTWWSVGLPLVRATTTAMAAIVFTVHWGAYLDALLYARGPAHKTMPLAVADLRNLDVTELPVMLAGAVLLALPPLVILLLAQRRLLSSVDIARDR